MSIRFKLKINIAIIIFLAFIFRLTFMNVYLLTTLETSPANKVIVSHFSNSLKKRKWNTESVIQSNFAIYSTVEVCEENPDNEEDLIKTNSISILSFLYSLLKIIETSPISNSLFGTIKYDSYPKKYLTLSTLRI